MNRTASIIHSREGVTQGDPLSMIAYSIGILPLINNLKREIPNVTQTWYDDNAWALGTFARLDTYFNSLTRQGLGRGYHPEPTKSVLIVRPENLEAEKVFWRRHVFKMCTGARYLGGYLRDNKFKRDWLREHTLMWEKNINTISKTAGKYPQESYATVVRAIQSYWISLTRHLGHGRCVRGSGEYDLINLFASSFLWKDEKPLPCRRSSKYNACQESRTGTPEYSDFSSG